MTLWGKLRAPATSASSAFLLCISPDFHCPTHLTTICLSVTRFVRGEPHEKLYGRLLSVWISSFSRYPRVIRSCMHGCFFLSRSSSAPSLVFPPRTTIPRCRQTTAVHVLAQTQPRALPKPLACTDRVFKSQEQFL